MFDFELCMDTGDYKSTYCRQPVYGIHEKNMNKNIQILKDNDRIYYYVSPWSSLLFLVVKPHQEGSTDTNDFFCRLCVSYRPLNDVTRSFEFLILSSAEIIEDVSDSSDLIYFICFDTRSGYHQVCVI